MLAPVVIDAIDDALDAVAAQASVLMARQPEAHADLDHEVAKRVVLCRPARVSEPSSTQRVAGQVSWLRALRERDLGDPIVGAAEVVDHFFFAFAIIADDTTPLTSRRRPA